MGLVVFVGSALAKLNGSLNSSPYADWATSGRAQRLLALVPCLKWGARLGELEEGLAPGRFSQISLEFAPLWGIT